MNLCFLTPAHSRYDVSAIVFAQRAAMIEQLRAAGIDAWALIVADDYNIDLARRHKFPYLAISNLPVGRKLNAGFAHALEQGADHVCFIGSDSLALPDPFLNLTPDMPCYGTWYTQVLLNPGQPIVVDALQVNQPTWALNIYPRRLLDKEPCQPHLNRGLDGSIRQTLAYRTEHNIDVRPHQVCTIRAAGHEYITSAQKLHDQYHHHGSNLGALIDAGYPKQTIDRIVKLHDDMQKAQEQPFCGKVG